VTLLGTTAVHYAGLHTVLVTGTQPEGYTDVIIGLLRLLGYQYSPRLADAGGATVWHIDRTDTCR
jgi:TnpA family transposase